MSDSDNVIPFPPRDNKNSNSSKNGELKAESIPNINIADRVRQLDQLPAIPELALKILKLRDNPDATVDQLVDVIMLDPALTAQVLRYANSPLFGQHGDVKTLDDAIFRVLGFETVLYLALGTALAKAFPIPEHGIIGLNRIWRNATYSAALMQNIADTLPREMKIQPGIAYLCGLLHNIGFLIMATIFHKEYQWLNHALDINEDQFILDIETQLLGTSHIELGNTLMTHWNMPAEIIAASYHHHDTGYDGDYKIYVQLTQLSDQLLGRHDLSDIPGEELPGSIFEELQLEDEQVNTLLNDVMDNSDVLDAMVNHLLV